MEPKKTASDVFGAMAKMIAKTVSSELSIFNSNTDTDPRKFPSRIWRSTPHTELFNIPDWDCPDTVKAPLYQGLEKN